MPLGLFTKKMTNPLTLAKKEGQGDGFKAKKRSTGASKTYQGISTRIPC